MIAHYLSTSLRHFRRHRFTTAINVACLALGLSCFVFAWGIAAYYDNGDHYQANAARAYFLTTKSVRPGNPTMTLTITPWILGETLKTDFPQLTIARVFAPPTREPTAINVNGVAGFAKIGFAEQQFLRVFDLPFLAGDAHAALDAPRSIVLSRDLALRLFGSDQVLGRTLLLSSRDTVTVTGVIDRIPAPSHLSTTGSAIGVDFEALASMDVFIAGLTHGAEDSSRTVTTLWGSNWFYTYALFPADGSITPQAFNEQLREFAARRVPALNAPLELRVEPIGRFWETTLNMIAATDRTGISSMTLLRALGTLVLLVACLNYANLAAAQAATRAKEVALQRIVGAGRQQILMQSLLEGLLLTCTALGVALLLVVGSVTMSRGSSTDLTRLFLTMPELWVGTLVLIAAVSSVASAYPALMVAGVRPADALQRAKVKSGPRFVATLLVGLQFGGASLLLIAVLVMNHQQEGLRTAVLAQTRDPVVILASDVKSAGVDSRLLANELASGRGVLTTSGLARVPWALGGNGVTVTLTDQPAAASIRASLSIVDYDFFATLGIERLAGRDFSRDRGLDVADLAKWNGLQAGSFAVVIDRIYARRLGFVNPGDAAGKVLYRPTSSTGATPSQQLTIIGVVADSTHVPLTGGVQGNLYVLNPAAAVVPVVRISSSELRPALAHIDSVWKRLAPNTPLIRHFADEQFDIAFTALESIRQAFAGLAAFAGLIAAMGLVGMALHVTRRRVHEIGVRKTLGATVPQILFMLLANFSKPVLIANIAIWPLVYVLMSGYLSIFSQSVGLTPTPFLLSLGATLLIAWAAVAVQATKAARLTPARVLRYE
jgi:putative ABC transport system permease protein